MSTPRIQSEINTTTEDFSQRRSDFLSVIETLRDRLSESLYQGRSKDVHRHFSRGQLTARDRIALVLDDESPFLELMPLAGYAQDGMTVGASIVAGIGVI